MRIDVCHLSEYRYSAPVFLEPHLLRLRPRSDGAQELRRFELTVAPESVSRAQLLDAEGNACTRILFEQPAEFLRIETRFEIELTRANPFDFVLEPDADRLDSVYNRTPTILLAPYRLRANESAEVTRLAAQVAQDSGGKTIAFLANLGKLIRERVRMTVRPTGYPYTAEECLRKDEASCRDLAVLFMDACRAQGLAARFVSGYKRGEPDQEHHLHAWAEVFLPGAGWRGFDPSLGLAVAQDHIVLATGQAPSAAAPVTGSFRGDQAQAEFITSIAIAARLA